MKLLQKLIQIKSFSGQERKSADFIVNYCRENNISTQKQDGNVLIYIKGKDQTKALIFNAHMDTVTAGDLSKWKFPPYGNGAGKIVNGKLYGLGASDDKGAIAAMLLLAKSLRHPGGGQLALSVVEGDSPGVEGSTKPPVDLWFVFVTNEETDGSGTAKFLTWFKHTSANWRIKRYKKISAIIGEPTGLQRLEIGHRGNYFLKLESFGVTGHGAKNYQEDDLAIIKIIKVIGKIKDGFEKWKKNYQDKIFGSPSLNITGIYSSDESMNQIPSSCSVTLDIRTTPRMHAKLLTWIKIKMGTNVELKEIEGKPPGLVGSTARIVKTFQKVIPAISLSTSLGSTDQAQFLEAGIEAVVFGPGEKEAMHKENEYIEVSKVVKCVKLYKKIIENY